MPPFFYIEDENAYFTPEYRQEYYRQFGIAMQMMRQINNVSIKEIADKMHVPENVIRGYESGDTIPFVDALFIYNYLNMQNRPVFRPRQ